MRPSRAAIFISFSIASTSIAAIRLNPLILRPDNDILFERVVVVEEREIVEEGDLDRGVESSELVLE